MLSCQKHLFSLPEDVQYLNCAYMAPLSRRVEAAGIAGMQRKRVPSTIMPVMFFEESDIARQRFAELVNGDAQRVALIPAASYGIAIVARNVEARPGQNLVVMHEQFPSNIYTWRRLSQQTGAALRVVSPPEGPRRGPRWNERILDAIDDDTALVTLSNVHWADGTRFDLDAVGARAREVGAAFVVDGTQSVGAMPLDVQQLRPDALICAAYKWLLGPYSTGVAYFGPRFDDGVPLEENWITRRDSEHFAGLVQYKEEYQPGAIRYDVGERSNFALNPMLVAGLEHVLEWGAANIQAYCEILTRDLLREAQALGFVIEDEAWRAAHLFGVRVPAHVPMDRLKQTLAERNVAVSVRGDAIRISPHVYNDAADLEALRDALHACLKPPAPVHATPS
jgi:selenocysteine lyase/cysteine desulfurase